MMNRQWIAAFVIVMVLNFACGVDNVAGNGSQTGNPMIVGKLFTADGTTPACEATVCLRTRNASSLSGSVLQHASDTAAVTRTDCEGIFTIDSIDTGMYVVDGTDGENNLMFIDSVAVKDYESTLHLLPAVLQPAGAIEGTIRLPEDGDLRKVFVIIPALDRFTTADSAGAYRFEHLAEGRYAMTFLPTLDSYDVFDTVGIYVLSAHTTTLDTVVLQFTGIPTVKNLTIFYDTLHLRVTLSWSRPVTALVKSFNVYRRKMDPATAVISQLNFFPVADTVYIDSAVEPNTTYEYHVTAVDSCTNEGIRSAGATTRIALYDLPPGNTVMVYDTIRQRVLLRWSNPDTALVKSFNVYRRNIRLDEAFWTPYNNRPIRDTFFVDSTFTLCPTDDGSCDDSADRNTPMYEYCVAALIHDVREGVRSAGMPLRICTTYLTPTNLNLTYDTLRQQVHLLWNRPDMTIVQGFVVLRLSIDGNETAFSQICNMIVNDTFFTDSTGAQNQHYEYCVAAIVGNNRAVVKSAGVKVHVAASFTEDSVFTLCGSGPEQLSFPNDIAIASNGDIYIVDQGNGRIQVFDGAMHFKRSVGVGILGYPLKVSVDEQGNVFAANYDSKRDCSSMYLFDSTGAMIDTIVDSTIINDCDVRSGSLYTITKGRTISIHSYDGTIQRSWQAGGQNARWIVAGDTNNILVSTGLLVPDKSRVVVYDSLGNGISSTTLAYFAGAAACDDRTKLLYAVGADGRGGSIMHVVDHNGVETARYKIRSDDQNSSIGIQKNGTVFIVVKSEGKILRLKPNR